LRPGLGREGIAPGRRRPRRAWNYARSRTGP
jgi:hypothetical protein